MKEKKGERGRREGRTKEERRQSKEKVRSEGGKDGSEMEVGRMKEGKGEGGTRGGR